LKLLECAHDIEQFEKTFNKATENFENIKSNYFFPNFLNENFQQIETNKKNDSEGNYDYTTFHIKPELNN
jgi:hypothetical protein